MIDWGELSASEKAEWMRICISNGIRDIGTIRELYNNNEYRDGGEKGSAEAKKEGLVGEALLEARAGTSIDPMAFWNRISGTEDKAREYYIKNNIRDSKEAPLVADYFRSYATSEGAQRILRNQQEWWKSRHPRKKHFLVERYNAFKPAKDLLKAVSGMPYEGVYDIDDFTVQSKFMSKPGAAMIKVGTQEGWGVNYPETTAHEMFHIYNAPDVFGYSKNSGIGGAQLEAINQNTNTKPGHDSLPEEKHSDIEGLRYLLFKEGIYDSRGKEDATPEDIKKLREKHPDYRPLLQMDDAKAAWMINNVASNNTLNSNLSQNVIANGGSIHIKPSHRGRFTALQERTGKSASWYKAHGTPAQRKMATFALNARKWHHGDGGYLEGDDEEYFGGTLPAATVSTTLPSIQSKQGQDIAKNMAERVASGQMELGEVPRRYYNYVQGEAKGAIPMRGYMDKATNIALGTLAVPLATMAAAEAAPVLAPGSALWSNPIVQQAVASELGGRTVDLISKDFTGKTWAENMSGAFDKVTGLNSSDTFVGQMASEMTNPGYLLSPSHFITKVGINRLPQAAFDNYANRLVKEGFTPSPKVAAEEPKLQQFPEAIKTTSKQELPPYEIEDLGGGYMLKSLMRGNPLEKQLSKQGTVNVNNVKVLINKGSDIEKTIVDKVLSSNEFANKKAIDYNKFRKAVQDELITYERTPDTRYQNYGGESLNWGGSNKDIKEWALSKGYYKPVREKMPYEKDLEWPREFIDTRTGEFYTISALEPLYKTEHGVTLNTFTFSSPRIANGSSKHYNANTLGHSRTYTTAEEPDILHVMESQSDWAQSGVAKEIKGDLAQSNDLIETYQWRIDQLEKETSTGIDQWGFPISEGSMADKRRILDDVKSWLEKELERNKELASTNSAQAKYLSDNYTTKQIQENLKYAAEQGQTKMRYPTRETAAKIEGYSKSRSQTLQDNPELQNHYDELRATLKAEEDRIVKKYAPKDYLDESMREADFGDMGFSEEETKRLIDQIRKSEEFEKSAKGAKMREEIIRAREKINPDKWLIENVPEIYIPQHETILRKYDAFPKQYKKLFKDADVRTVTDSKGNTWYEVDVPKDYLKKEWIYSTIPVGIGLSEGKEENSYADGGPLGDKDTLSHPKYNASSEKAMYDYLVRSGLNDAQVSGIMGNLAVESLLNSNINQFNGPAYGLIQAEGVRKKALKEYQGSPYVFGSGLLPEEQKQLDYIIDMGINNYTPGEWGRQGYSGARAARNAFINSSDVDEASDIFMKNYLRPGKPHQDRRRNMSNYYFNKYGKSNYIFKDSKWNLQNILTK